MGKRSRAAAAQAAAALNDDDSWRKCDQLSDEDAALLSRAQRRREAPAVSNQTAAFESEASLESEAERKKKKKRDKKEKERGVEEKQEAAIAGEWHQPDFEPEHKAPTNHLLRCAQPLYVHIDTFLCCARKCCVSCAHKIIGVEQMEAGLIPNVRPEMCPRSGSSTLREQGKGIGLYPAASHVLTVGDGDLSFSLALARALGGECVTATTWEARSDILRIYQTPDILKELQKRKVSVKHQVDAADLPSTLDPQIYQYDYCVFNFPCVAPTESPGLDGQMQHYEENKVLLRDFGWSAAQLLQSRGGRVHVSHKTKAAFGQWALCEQIQAESGLECLGAFVFDRCLYPGYVNRKAQDKKSFPVSDAVTFCFGFPGDQLDIAADWFCQPEENSTWNLSDLVKLAKESDKVCLPVTREMVECIKIEVLAKTHHA